MNPSPPSTGGPPPDVVVIGGGVIGCSVARVAALGGAEVLVLEAGASVAGAASGAAGGMLSPLGEAPRPGPFLQVGVRSLDLYPAFVAALEAETGISLELRRDGKLFLALDEEQERGLRGRMEWQLEEGHDVVWLDSREVRAVEPAVAPSVRGALHLPAEGSVDNRRLLEALRSAVRAGGGRVRTGAPAAEVLRNGSRVRGVRLEGGERVPAETVVLAAGAWSGGLEGLPRPVPIRPVRGQMVALEPEERLSRTVAGGGVYLVPRGPGSSLPGVWVGATQEEAGFEAFTTAKGIRRLLEGAERIVPALGPARVRELWAGLRPGTPDDRPLLGRDPEVEGLLYATGHFRNGILLAPITGEAVGALCLGREPDLDLAPFAPDRFPPELSASGRSAQDGRSSTRSPAG